MKITWIGHSCFKLESDGYSVITDPYAPGSVPGLDPVMEEADTVLCSHQHGDHNYKEGVKLLPGSERTIRIVKIPCWHDEVRGKKRGDNLIHIIDFGKEKAVHLGDLGHQPDPAQIEEMKGTDVLLIPVGGFYTIDGKEAALIVKQLQPRVVIPMHYRDDEYEFGYSNIGTVKEFLANLGTGAKNEGMTIDTADYAGEKSAVVVMTPKNKR